MRGSDAAGDTLMALQVLTAFVFCTLREFLLLLSVMIWIVNISVYTLSDACCGDQILPSQVKIQLMASFSNGCPVLIILVASSSHGDTHFLTGCSLNGDALQDL